MINAEGKVAGLIALALLVLTGLFPEKGARGLYGLDGNSARELEGELRGAGFQFVRQKGSHQIWRGPTGRTVVLPYHSGGRDISPGVARSIRRSL